MARSLTFVRPNQVASWITEYTQSRFFSGRIEQNHLNPGAEAGHDYADSAPTESDDAKWSYFREDSLLHDFHDKFHSFYGTAVRERWQRSTDLFQYMHQQLLRRYLSA